MDVSLLWLTAFDPSLGEQVVLVCDLRKKNSGANRTNGAMNLTDEGRRAYAGKGVGHGHRVKSHKIHIRGRGKAQGRMTAQPTESIERTPLVRQTMRRSS